MRAIALLGLLLVGCSKGGIDAVPGDAPADPDAPPPPDTVIGKLYVECVGQSAMATRPVDGSALAIEALLPDAGNASGFRVVPGVGRADGTFEIAGVPDGVEYMLRLGIRYYVTSQHKIDRHFRTLGRCELARRPALVATPFHVAVSNMQPFLSGTGRSVDRIEVGSLAVSAGFLLDAAPGATEVAGDLVWPVGEILPDRGLGDDLRVLHHRSGQVPTTAGGKRRSQALVDALDASSTVLREGTPASLTGTFPPAVRTSASITMTASAFHLDPSIDDVTSSLGVTLFALPAAGDLAFGDGVVLADVDFTNPTFAPSETAAVAYADPFPASWSRVLQYHRFATRHFLRPSDGNRVFNAATSIQERRFDGGPVAPVPGLLPTEVRIAGLGFGDGGMIPFDGIAPVEVRWTGVATAKVYALHVSRIEADENGSALPRIASLFTTQTSIRIPATVFAGDEIFVFQLEAVQSPARYDAGELGFNGLPSQVDSLMSGLFRLTATCGNREVDPGEACDTGSETSACDVDCSRPICGDGLRNAAAGELCDTGGSTAECDGDCTLPVCGDGVTNQTMEACDDGNQVDDGNGCSADCRFNNVCGNTRFEIYGETCDEGGVDTESCNADCTFSFCNDGYRNAAAGEECDDGNFDESDHCRQCKIN